MKFAILADLLMTLGKARDMLRVCGICVYRQGIA